MGLLSVVGESVSAVTEVILISLFGAYLARKGVMSNTAIKLIEKVLVEIFTPSLIISKVIPHADASMVLQLWPLIAVCGWNIFWGLILGYILATQLFGRNDLKGVIQAGLAFPNAISVCLTLSLALCRANTIQSIAVDHGNISGNVSSLILYSDSGEFAGYSEYVEEYLSERATVVVMTSTLWWNLARWTIAYNLLSYDAGDSWKSRAKKVFNPPVYACIAAFVIGFTPFLQSWWLSDHVTAILVTTAFNMIGRCTVPCTLVVLGARVYNVTHSLLEKKEPETLELTQENAAEVLLDQEAETSSVHEMQVYTNGSDEECPAEETAPLPAIPVPAPEEGVPLRINVTIIVFRQGVCMLLGLVLATMFTHVTDDVMVLTVGFLQTAGPPMINLAIMAGLHGSFETDVTKLLMMSYIASICTWTVSIAAYLYMLNIRLG